METLNSSNILSQMAALDLSTVGYLIVGLLTVYITHWIYKWRNPKCNGVLPPGSMGLPLIGETIQLVIPNASLDLPPFIKKRMKRYGPIFRTNVAGRPVIITADPEFNHFLLRQDGKLVDTWSMDTFAEVFDQASQSSRKYTRHLTLNHFGVEALREKLLPQMEDMVRTTLSNWSSQESVEVKSASVTMAIDYAARQIYSGNLENAPLKISDLFRDLVDGLMSFPINIPGTAHHRCLQTHKKVREMMKDIVRTRLEEPERQYGDMLDHMIEDMKKESFLDEDFIVQLMFGLFFVTSDSISTTLALAFKLLAEHPLVLEELTAEHEAILKKREKSESHLTWNDYKSMTFTLQVINEVLRLGNIAPGFFRRALQDIPVNGYTIPSGWVIMIATAGLHLNSNQFEDPLKFNPWRWKELQPSVIAKCFMPFGSGMKQCAGAEYSRVLLATFIHVLVTKYRWAIVKGGKIVRSPIIRFPDGFHYKIIEKTN
ncbi:cytochrome P450 87A3-like [Olea europaea subsp. europaea]|uniref:Cytochrome P450 87A3-like n=1 Tax=Olea europaea subsp. europaea TaxID=158383 RepID=A0A8S0RH20_OLEEU|nr:cytochrome P450 87A3-like [Olea europaea subsp. europaea]